VAAERSNKELLLSARRWRAARLRSLANQRVRQQNSESLARAQDLFVGLGYTLRLAG
jgi:hypothetical protein